MTWNRPSRHRTGLFGDLRKLSYLELSLSLFKGTMRRLPYLNGIRAFEAAARAGSFASAAKSSTSRRRREPDGAAARAAGWAEPVRARGQSAGADTGRTQLPGGLGQIFDALANLTDQVKASRQSVLTSASGRPSRSAG